MTNDESNYFKIISFSRGSNPIQFPFSIHPLFISQKPIIKSKTTPKEEPLMKNYEFKDGLREILSI